jgi:hypothetical protein
MIRNMYSRDGYSILTACRECGRVRYCEQHGTTAPCKCSAEWTESVAIPYQFRCGRGNEGYCGPAKLPAEYL